MPGRRCAVLGCKNSKIVSKLKGLDIILHSFPKGNDTISTLTQDIWLDRCKRPNPINPNTSQICSTHFKEDDYERDLKNELLGLPLRRMLKKNAVPTLHLPDKQSYTSRYEVIYISSEWTDNSENSTDISNTDKISLENSSQKDTNEPLKKFCEWTNNSENSTDFNNSDKRSLKNPCQKDNTELVKKFCKLREQFKNYKRENRHEMKRLQSQLNYYKKQLYKQKNLDKGIELLKKVFTPNQILLLNKKKKVIRWTHDEIHTAFTIQHYSKNCYLYLRNELHYPLPALSSLRRWAANNKIQ